LYAHLSSVDVSCGQQLEQGDIIGKIGKTGNATGSMLHFELIMNNAHVNPHEYLPAK
jgi:murein DD-endopeptidase MepM/ murein hydrolase activator NlpD